MNIFLVRIKKANELCKDREGLWVSESSNDYCDLTWEAVELEFATIYTNQSCNGVLKKIAESWVGFEFELIEFTQKTKKIVKTIEK